MPLSVQPSLDILKTYGLVYFPCGGECGNLQHCWQPHCLSIAAVPQHPMRTKGAATAGSHQTRRDHPTAAVAAAVAVAADAAAAKVQQTFPTVADVAAAGKVPPSLPTAPSKSAPQDALLPGLPGVKTVWEALHRPKDLKPQRPKGLKSLKL